MFECKLCEDNHERFKTIEGLYSHLERKHHDEIPPDWSVEQFAYYLKTGKKHGTCVICKGKTKFNPKTGKYYRLCENPKCKEKNREIFEKRMIGKYGKVSLLDDPEQQKKMLANRSISGEYTWSDGTKKTYTGSYEYDFLRFLDVLMDYPSRDVITPSPHTYYYEYEGKKHFYIPDVYIESLNLEIEIKDGGDNPNTHHKIQDVDKVKERLKDQVLLSQTSVSYIKITNKSYDTFMKYLMELKDQYNKLDRREKFTPIFILAENYNEEILGEIVTEADENTDYTDGVSDETEMNTGNDSSSVYYACDTTGLKTIKPTKDANGNECIYASPFKEYAATKGLKLNNSQLSISSKVGEEISMNVKLLDKEANVDRVFSVYELNGDGFTPVTTNGKESKTVYMKKGHAEVIREFKIKNYRKYIKRFPNVKCEDFPTDKQIKEKEVAKESATSSSGIFRLDFSNKDGETIKPTIPNNYFTKNGYEDNKTARVCFTNSIDNCLRALSQKCTGMELYVHVPVGSPATHKPSLKEVPDAKVTNEIWVTEPVELKCIGKIKVDGDKGEDGLPFKYGNKTAELYDWKWHWISHSAKESFDLLDALLYSHNLAQGMEFLTEEMRDASPEEQKSVMENIKSISEPTGINFYDEVEEASRRNDLHGISPNKKFYILPFFEMMDLKNWGASPIYTGKFKEARPRILKKVSWCETQDDIKYLLRDASYGITQLTKLRNDLDYALKNPDDKKSKYEELRKRNKKGLTVESIDEHIKWIKEEYREAIYAKRDELKAVKESLETVEEGKMTDIIINEDDRKIHTGILHLEKEYGVYVNGKYNAIAQVEGFKFKCRGRSELLVIKGDSVYLAKNKSGLYGNYSVPGGGWDPKEPHDVSAIREAEEEARLSTKNVQYGGNYLTEYSEPHKWVQEKIPKKDQWRAYYTEVYIGEYTGKFNGHIDEEDKDDIINVGKFYPISEVRGILNPIHRRVIDAYIRQRDMMKVPSHLYRVTYEDDGIYEAFRKNATFEEWKAFKDSNAAKWLPIPSKYGDSDVSYFTEEGFKKFRELTLPLFETKLDTDKIIAIKVKVPNGKITYHDKYQYVIEPEKATESLEVREKFKYGDTPDIQTILLEMNRELNMYEYGIPKNGVIQDIPSEEYYYNNWRYLSPKEFSKVKGGTCWDYVAYQTEYLASKGITTRNFYIIDDNGATHTISIVISNGKFYYPESSFKRIRGLYVHKNLKSILRFVVKEMGIKNYRIYEFKKNTNYGCSCVEYMQWMENKGKLISKGNASYIPNILTDKPVNIQTIEPMPKDRRVNESLELVEEEAHYSSTDKYPVFIVLMHTGTTVAKAIQAFTKDEFSHACISFNSKLDPLYSFGYKELGDNRPGFVANNPKSEFFTKYHTYYSVFVTFVNKKQYDAMKQRLEYFKENADNLKFDRINMLACGMGVSSEKSKKYFCSRFCMEIIGQGVELEKVPSLYRPQDMSELDNISLVNKGADFYNYDYKETEKNLNKIKKGSKSHE